MPTMEASPISSNPSLTLQKPIIRPEDSTFFKIFRITRAGLGDFIFSSTFDDQTFRGEISLYNSKKRDVILHQGTDTKDLIIGNADLKTFSGHYTIEVGDYLHSPVTVERLDRLKGWSSRHSFTFSFGGAEREAFIWRHKGEKFTDHGKSLNGEWDDMELVTSRNDDEEDLLVAQYLKRDLEYRGWKSRGVLQMRSEGGREWERMVILSLTALLVTKNREQ